jgi:hypothetical protein
LAQVSLGIAGGLAVAAEARLLAGLQVHRCAFAGR